MARLRVSLQLVGVKSDIVRDHQRPRLNLFARELKKLLVEAARDVEEDDVKDVVDQLQGLPRVALDQLGRLLEPGLGEIASPGGDPLVVALERKPRPPK